MCGAVRWIYLQYNLCTGLYMLEPWEKTLFNSVAGGIGLATAYYSYAFLNEHIDVTS